MKRLRLLAKLMPNAKVCENDQMKSIDFMDGPTALRVAVRVDRVPDWFALVGMLKEFGAYVKRYQFDQRFEFPEVQTLSLDFEDGYRDRANKGHDRLFFASSDLQFGPRN